MSEELFYQENQAGLYIRAIGHVTASVSVDLRELITNRLARKPVPLGLFVDLSHCEYMDSTFMGLLVGFHKRFRSLSAQPLSIVNPSPECIKLLTGLGILKLMQVVEASAVGLPSEWVSVTKTLNPTPEVVLNAHKDLSELSPENEKKFSLLQTVLEQQLEKKD